MAMNWQLVSTNNKMIQHRPKKPVGLLYKKPISHWFKFMENLTSDA